MGAKFTWESFNVNIFKFVFVVSSIVTKLITIGKSPLIQGKILVISKTCSKATTWHFVLFWIFRSVDLMKQTCLFTKSKRRKTLFSVLLKSISGNVVINFQHSLIFLKDDLIDRIDSNARDV